MKTTIITLVSALILIACNNIPMKPIGMTKGVITSLEDLNRKVYKAPPVMVDTTGDGVADISCSNTFTDMMNGGIYDPRGMEVDVRVFADSGRTHYVFEAYLRRLAPSDTTTVFVTDSLQAVKLAR